MPVAQKLDGREVGLLTVERLAHPAEHGDHLGRRMWRCRCRCGAIVYSMTSGLNAGRCWACPACGGPKPQSRWPCICLVCGRSFQGRGNICSKECRRARRRATDAGAPEAGGLPPPTRNCVWCGKSFIADRNSDTCSAECRTHNKRWKQRESWYRRVARDPNLMRRMNQRRRQRAARDPEYAEKLRKWDAMKYVQHRERMAADPEYAAQYRARSNARYAAHREIVQARRRARLDALSPDDLEAWLARARRYCRHWRRKYREKVARDPVAYQKLLDTEREYRHQRRRRQLLLNAARIELEAKREDDDPGNDDLGGAG